MVQAKTGTRLAGSHKPAAQLLRRFFPGESASPITASGSQPNPAQIVSREIGVCASAQAVAKTVSPVSPDIINRI